MAGKIQTSCATSTGGRVRALASALGLLALAFSTAPVSGADKKAGAKLAQRCCASCHVVSPDQAKGATSAPTFAWISSNRNVAAIKGALSMSHTQMPDMSLTRKEVDDILDYIQSLAPPLDPVKRPPQKDKPPKTHRG